MNSTPYFVSGVMVLQKSCDSIAPWVPFFKDSPESECCPAAFNGL